MSSSLIEIQLNGSELSVKEGTLVSELLGTMKLSHAAVAVEINSEICARNKLESREIVAGDVIEVVSLVGGG